MRQMRAQRLKGLLLVEGTLGGFVSHDGAVIDDSDSVTKSQFSEVGLMCNYSLGFQFGVLKDFVGCFRSLVTFVKCTL